MNYIRYLVPCITEGTPVVTDYVSDKPTCCPNNISHTINAAGIRQIDGITPPKPVTVDQSSGLVTSHQYRVDCYTVSCENEVKIRYPYNVCIHTITFLPSVDNIGLTIDLSMENGSCLIQNLSIINTDDISFGLCKLSSIPIKLGDSLVCTAKSRNNSSVIQFYLEIEY